MSTLVLVNSQLGSTFLTFLTFLLLPSLLSFIVPSPILTLRVLITTPSRFWLIDLCACVCVRFDNTFVGLNYFLLAICLKQYWTCHYEWNERENTRISRMQATTPSLKRREQRRTGLACEKKEQRTLRLQERRLHLHREARRRRKQSRRGLKKQARNHRSDS